MATDFAAQLYTSRGKYSVQVTLDYHIEEISYSDPEHPERVIIGWDGELALIKHGWVFSDFSVTDAINSPPAWRHKLTFYKWDDRHVAQALSAWRGCDPRVRRGRAP